MKYLRYLCFASLALMPTWNAHAQGVQLTPEQIQQMQQAQKMLQQMQQNGQMPQMPSADQIQQIQQQAQQQQQQLKQQMQEHCASNAENYDLLMTPELLAAYQKAPYNCTTLTKQNLCAGFQKHTSDPDFLSTHQRWQEMAGDCGFDTTKITASACKTAKQKEDWEYAVTYCDTDKNGKIDINKDPELKNKIATEGKTKCGGMNYTSANQKEIDLCNAYQTYIVPTQPAQTTTEDKVQKASDTVNKLRNLF